MKRKGILCFIIREEQVLFAKIDYGKGNVVWNGISGFIEPNEQKEDAVLREIEEEIGIKIDKKYLEYRGSHKVSDELQLEIFVAYGWDGVPTPQEVSIKELKWFSKDNLPYDEMFPGNKDWVLKFIK